MTKIISYPSGAFGNFLAYLLNYAITRERYVVNESVYDFSKSAAIFFEAKHLQSSCEIYINVSNESYLKYLITNINRVTGIDLIIEELHIDTFNKIKSHRSLMFFEKSLIDISNKSQGDISPKYIREWFRLCFFANNCKAISEYIGPRPESSYILDFETFFSRDSIKKCVFDILEYFKFKIDVPDLSDTIDEFFSKQRYKNHINIDVLKNSIQKNQNITLNLNIVEQAWLDNWLVDSYKIEPRLINEYFSNTKELIDFYNLPVDALKI